MATLINALRQYLFFKLINWLQTHEYKPNLNGTEWFCDMTESFLASMYIVDLNRSKCGNLNFKHLRPAWHMSAIDWYCYL